MKISLLLVTVFAAASCAGASSPEEQKRKDFLRAMAYEYKTCQMTSLMMASLAKDASGKEAAVWQAYHRLYTFNRSLYDPLAASFGLSAEPSWFTRFRGFTSALAGKLFPHITLRMTQRLATKYVHKLRAMRDIGPTKHRVFLDYIVRMEELQVSFLADAVQGDYTKAGGKVDQFLAENAFVKDALQTKAAPPAR